MLTNLLRNVPGSITWMVVVSILMWFFTFQLGIVLVLVIMTFLVWGGAIEGLHLNDVNYGHFMLLVSLSVIGGWSYYKIDTFVEYNKIVSVQKGTDYNVTYDINSDNITIRLATKHKIVKSITVSKDNLERIKDITDGKFTLERRKYSTWYSQNLGFETTFKMDK